MLRFLSERLGAHRLAIRSRWRRLPAGRQALLVLAHLRCGHMYAQLAAGFGVGVATAYRYMREAVDLLAGLAPTLAEAMRVAATKHFDQQSEVLRLHQAVQESHPGDQGQGEGQDVQVNPPHGPG